MASSPADSLSDLELGGRLSRRLFGIDAGELPPTAAAEATVPPFRVSGDDGVRGPPLAVPAGPSGPPPAAPAPGSERPAAPAPAASSGPFAAVTTTARAATAAVPASAATTAAPTVAAAAEPPLPDLRGDWQALASWCFAALGAESVVLVDRRGLLLATAGVGAGRQLQGTGARLLYLLEQCDAFGRGSSRSVEIELAGVRLYSTRVTTADGIALTLAVSSRSELPARARARAAQAVAAFKRS